MLYRKYIWRGCMDHPFSCDIFNQQMVRPRVCGSTLLYLLCGDTFIKRIRIIFNIWPTAETENCVRLFFRCDSMCNRSAMLFGVGAMPFATNVIKCYRVLWGVSHVDAFYGQFRSVFFLWKHGNKIKLHVWHVGKMKLIEVIWICEQCPNCHNNSVNSFFKCIFTFRQWIVWMTTAKRLKK